MSFGRVLGGAFLFVLVAAILTLAQTDRTRTFVLSEGATAVDPHLYAESVTTPPSPDPEFVLEDRLAETTTTEYVTTTTVTAETTSSQPESSDESTATTQPKSPKASTPTTAPPPPPSSTTTTAPAPGGYNSGYESTFASKINSLRASNGLGALSRTGSLDAEARAWSKQMAQQGSLSHSGIGRLIPPWSSVAENVGSGPSVNSIFGALTNSSGHLQHMLGDYTNLGVGVWVDSNGVLWTTHIFSK